MAETYVAQRRLRLGGDRFAEIGDPIPEAGTWPNVSTYVRLGWIKLENVDSAALATATGAGQAEDLSGLTAKELKARAKANGLTGYSRLSKPELVDLLTG